MRPQPPGGEGFNPPWGRRGYCGFLAMSLHVPVLYPRLSGLCPSPAGHTVPTEPPKTVSLFQTFPEF